VEWWGGRFAPGGTPGDHAVTAAAHRAHAAESVPVPEVVTAARTLAALAVDVCGTVQWD
jgi:hypothetical protein